MVKRKVFVLLLAALLCVAPAFARGASESSDDEVVDKLISTGILTDNLSVAITAAERKMAITEFENAIALEKSESYWQTWFEKNKWVLGSEYLNIY